MLLETGTELSVSLGTTGDRVPLESPCPAPHTRPRSTQAPFAALHADGSSPQTWNRTRTHAPRTAHGERFGGGTAFARPQMPPDGFSGSQLA